MKRLFPVCLFLSLALTSGHAGPSENAIMAMMRLSDQPNYSWIATVSDDARTYYINGKTVRGGFTRVKMPVINSVRRHLGRNAIDTDIEMIFRGNVDCVIETDDGWRTPAELPLKDLNDSGAPPAPGTIGALTGGPTNRSIRGSIVRMPRVAAHRAPGDRGYSNLQLAISHPHEELGIIVGSHTELNIEGDVITGTLTNLGAQLLLVRDGQETIEPLRASGTFKLWLRDGMVTKYHVKLEGTLKVHFSSGRREINVQQVTETVLKDIGATKFEVPAQARVKLGA